MEDKIIENVEQCDNYEVGYKKPPKETQFKKGQSGNPSGRKKKPIPKSLHEAIVLELADIVTIKENGKAVKMPKYELLAKAIINDAIKSEKGNSRKIVIEQMFKTDVLEYKDMLVKRAMEAEPEMDPEQRAECRKFLDELMDRLYREQINLEE